jgi:hypothetical protein
MSERRACKAIGYCRMTIKYQTTGRMMPAFASACGRSLKYAVASPIGAELKACRVGS